MKDKDEGTKVINFAYILTIILFTAKAFGHLVSMPWWKAFFPLYVIGAVFVLFYLLAVIYWIICFVINVVKKLGEDRD